MSIPTTLRCYLLAPARRSCVIPSLLRPYLAIFDLDYVCLSHRLYRHIRLTIRRYPPLPASSRDYRKRAVFSLTHYICVAYVRIYCHCRSLTLVSPTLDTSSSWHSYL